MLKVFGVHALIVLLGHYCIEAFKESKQLEQVYLKRTFEFFINPIVYNSPIDHLYFYSQLVQWYMYSIFTRFPLD